MDAHRTFLQRETRQLIKSVTDFQEDEENFDICLNYALSNFASFEHPDVDWFKVKKRVSGLCERYAVDSEHVKSRKLKTLSTKYLEIINNEEIKKKTSGFAILSFLCSLAGSVNDGECPSILRSLKKTDATDDSPNWSKILREDDLDVKSLSDSDQSNWSESDDESDRPTLPLPLSPPPPSVDSGLGETPDSCCAPSPSFEQFRPYRGPDPPKEPVQVETPYWNPYYQQTRLRGDNSNSNFTQKWEQQMSKRYAIYLPERNVVLKERNVMREIIWMLHGAKKSFLFPWVDGQYHVKQYVHLAHITEETLQKMVQPLCHYGDKMVVFMEFIKSMQSFNSPRNCQTVRAYATGLHWLILQYTDFLSLCEKLIIDQKEVMTFFKLTLALEPQLKFLMLLYNLHMQIMTRFQKCSSAFERATVLLDYLWNELAHSNLWMTKPVYLQAILMLFLTSLYPYIHMLESSITSGRLIDPFQEFLLENTSTETNDDKIWDCGMKLRSLPDSVPKYFLRSLFDDILLASKSIRMMQSFKGIYEDDQYIRQDQDHLFPEFVETFEKLYKSLDQTPVQDPPEEEISSISCNFRDYDLSEALAKIQDKQTKRAPNQKKLFDEMKKECLDMNQHQRYCQRIVDMVEVGTPVPISSILEEALLPCIRVACQSSKQSLAKALKQKHHLLHHISVMRKYFLMECGDAMFSFYTEIFRKILDEDEWENTTYLNCVFKDYIPATNFEGCEGLVLNLDNDEEEKDTKKHQTSYFGLDKLSISYNVGWPINLILSKSTQDVYCKIFQFLLQVKCVKYSMDDLYCYRLNGKRKRAPVIARKWIKNTEISEKQIIHGMHILRMQLLHFINGYHSYIMTRILHSSGIQLDDKLEAAESLVDILSAHHEYIYTLQENCLLNSNHNYLWEHIQILLGLAIKFQTIWRAGAENINVKEVQSIEQQYCSSINFLMSYLSKPRKRGSNLHLDALANSIFTRFQHHQVFSK